MAEDGISLLLDTPGSLEGSVSGSVLIEEPPDEDGQDEKKCEESPPRAECEQHDECRGIHRMPHESIGARRDDRLVFGDLNRRGAVAVFLEHEKDEQEPKGDQGIPSTDTDAGTGDHPNR